MRPAGSVAVVVAIWAMVEFSWGLAAVDEPLAKREIADWLALALNHNP